MIEVALACYVIASEDKLCQKITINLKIIVIFTSVMRLCMDLYRQKNTGKYGRLYCWWCVFSLGFCQFLKTDRGMLVKIEVKAN